MSAFPPYPLPFCLGLCVYRLVAKPCAHILRIQAGVPRRAQPNDVLERVYHSRTVHKAFACSVVPLKSSSTRWSTVVIALKHTTTAIMIPSVPTKMWRDSHTYMSCVFFPPSHYLFVLCHPLQSPDTKQLEGLSKQLDWEVRKIQRWFRVRRNQDRPSMQKKFCESM